MLHVTQKEMILGLQLRVITQYRFQHYRLWKFRYRFKITGEQRHSASLLVLHRHFNYYPVMPFYGLTIRRNSMLHRFCASKFFYTQLISVENLGIK